MRLFRVLGGTRFFYIPIRTNIPELQPGGKCGKYFQFSNGTQIYFAFDYFHAGCELISVQHPHLCQGHQFWKQTGWYILIEGHESDNLYKAMKEHEEIGAYFTLEWNYYDH